MHQSGIIIRTSKQVLSDKQLGCGYRSESMVSWFANLPATGAS